MPPATKRPRSRSASPTLPLHLLTSLPGTSSTSSTHANNDPATALRLPDYLAQGVQAHEASLLPAGEGERWEGLREELEEDPPLGEAEGLAVAGHVKKGKRRVRWTGTVGDEGSDLAVWTDRKGYDILHLLPSLPSRFPLAPPSRSATQPAPSTVAESEPGFEELPSDHEELFYFSPGERADLEKRKKRRRMEEEREERVRMREEEDRKAEGDGKEPKEGDVDWEAGDEPAPTLLALMQRLHTTLSSSPNPSLLELRILANHGSDPRFRSFMRKEGKWYGLWERIKAGEDVSGKTKEDKKEKEGGLAGLAAYGSDSEEESEEEAEKPEEVKEEAKVVVLAPYPPTALSPSSCPPTSTISDQAASPSATPPIVDTNGTETGIELEEDEEETRRKQREKQEKLKEWAKKRREKRKEGEQ